MELPGKPCSKNSNWEKETKKLNGGKENESEKNNFKKSRNEKKKSTEKAE